MPTVASRGVTAGQRFGGRGGVPPFSAGRFGQVNCELPYMRHRKGAGKGIEPRGRVTMAFVDGHAELLPTDRLVDGDGLSTGVCSWTTADIP